MKRLWLLACIVLWLPFSVVAESVRYVSDVLWVPVRTDVSSSARTIKHIKSGTVVSVLGESDDGKLLNVEVQDAAKTRGWVTKRYLLSDPIAKMELKQLKNTMAALESKQGPMVENFAKLKATIATLESEKKSLLSQKKEVETRMGKMESASAQGLALYNQNEQLKELNSSLQKQVADIRQENQLLKENHRNEGIKLGLLAVAAGGFAGFLLPYVKPRGRKQRGVRLR
ncbi:MAG: TIGR04211 family SH3 domain-containing protein [Pseudobacteriovorax sp.]|nr:TIGR04211 family SH3 domain-containing protein [Pseudobacteriovorax sp.]